MSEQFLHDARRLIKTGEGSIPHMYLDSVGKVTVGVGNMLPDAHAALALPFVVKENGAPASPAQIQDEFNLVLRQEPRHPAPYYSRYCDLMLTDEEINALLDRRIDDFEAGLRQQFQHFDQFPEQAKLGMLDMAFNLGISGLVSKFPAFTRAARSADWETCAIECKRKQVQTSRNETVKQLFLSCTG